MQSSVLEKAPKHQDNLLEVEFEGGPESAGPVNTVREGHGGRNTNTRSANLHQTGDREESSDKHR